MEDVVLVLKVAPVLQLRWGVATACRTVEEAR
jgi:hypothetical protein